MHIHGNQMNVNAANSYSVANGERAAAAVRKRLLKSAAGVDEAATPDVTLMIGRWLTGSQGQSEGDGEYHSGSSGKDSDLG